MPDRPLIVLNNLARRAIQRPPGEAREASEKCGVFGVWGGPEPARLAYYGLYAQQHRGQEAAGLAVTNGRVLQAHTGVGLVPEVFAGDGAVIAKLDGPAGTGGNGHAAPAWRAVGAIGHNRYSTAGGSLACNAQPLLESYVGGQVAVAHNGNLVNAEALRRDFEQAGHLFHTTSDTEVIVHLLASPDQQKAADPVAATLRRLQGAFSLLLLFKDRIEAARDPWGWRPLVLGKLSDGRIAVASETVALDVVGAEFLREVEPGEIVTISDGGVSSRRFADAATPLAQCVFEHVYFANPASQIFGQNVQLVREALGERLALESPVQADFVVPMPDSGRSAAVGYARQSAIPFREAIVPNRYVGRTFIKPSQAERDRAVRLKLNVIAEAVRGKTLVIVDDSIVRGTTTKTKIKQIRDAGAKAIHLRISCPPIRHPCFFGVDFDTRDQLIAHNKSVQQIAEFVGVDSLAYLSLDGLLGCVKRPRADYCTACYSGDYRIDVEHPTVERAIEPQLKMF